MSTVPPRRIGLRIARGAFVALVAASLMNVLAGVRRPLAERAILKTYEYASAHRAWDAIKLRVPPAEPVTLVTRDRETEEWLWEYLQWVAYPKTFDGEGAATSNRVRKARAK